MAELTPRLTELKSRFIIPNEAVADLVRARHRQNAVGYYYCPYAPCCSDCRSIFTFREVLGHLRKVHEHDSGRVKRLVAKGLPRVPEKRT